MNVTEILTFGCTNAGTTLAQVTSAQALIFANITYHELEECIRSAISEDYFYDYFTTDTVLWQNEYVLEAQTSTSNGINKIISVGTKYKAEDTSYSNVRAYSSAGLYFSEEYSATNQSQGDPFYIIKENSIFLYPTPTVSVDVWLRVHASISLVDLTTSGDATTVKIPLNFHYVIWLWMKRYIWGLRSLDGLAKYGNKEYEDAKRDLINYLKNRTITPIDQDLPNLTSLSY